MWSRRHGRGTSRLDAIMRTAHAALCALLLLFSVAALPALAAQAGARGEVRGIVTDATNGAPVRATITVSPTARTVRADSAGRFVMTDVATGSIVVRASAFGYRSEQRREQLRAGEPLDVQFSLVPLPQSLSTVRTTASRNDELAPITAPGGAQTVTMSRQELSIVPAVGETDVLRAASLLPGIAARNDFWAGFNIRGGESDQTLVRLDGVPVLSPFHLGGLFSTFIPDAVQSVDARVGALPVSDGGRLSGALDVTSADEARSGVHGAVDITAISTAAKVGGAAPGLFTTTRGTWNVAVRRTYVDALAGLLKGRGSFPYHFQDAELHGAFPVRGGGTLGLTAYAGTDLLNITPGETSLLADSGTAVRFQWGNRVVGATYTQPLGSTASFVQRVSFSGFTTRYADADNGATLYNRLDETRASGDVLRRIGQASPLTVSAGYALASIRTRYDEHISARAADEAFGTDIAIDDTVITQRTTVASLHGEAVWAPRAWVSVRAGLRGDRVSNAGAMVLTPRFTMSVTPRDRLTLSAAIGRYSQWTHAVRNEDLPVRIVDIWFVSDSNVPVSTGTERVIGGDYRFTDDNIVRVNVYSRTFTSLVEPASTVDPRLRPSELLAFGGTSTGAELLLRHLTTARWGGWLAYSYGRSTRERDGVSYAAAHDRRHDLNVVGSYQLNERYTFGARLGLASGTPYTGWGGTYARWTYDPIARRWRNPGFASDARNEQVRTARNGERYPAYERLDLSAHRAFRFRGNEADAFLNLVNVFDTQNVLAYTIDNEASPPVLRGLSQLPFLPSVGVRLTF